MARLAMVGFLLLAISPLGAMGDETSDAKKALKALTESFEQKMQEWQAGFGTLESDEDRQKHFENRPTADSTAAEIMALAAKHREEIGLDAVMWVMQNRASGEGQKQALGMLKEGIQAQYQQQAPEENVGARVARRKERYAESIGEASSWKSRLKPAVSVESVTF